MRYLIYKPRLITIGLLGFFIFGCQQKSDNNTNYNPGYYNSKTFAGYLEDYEDDSLRVKKIDVNLFEKLELKDFLYGDSSARFVVYIFANFNNDSTYVYKVKEIGKELSTSVSGFRESKLLNDTVNFENAKFLEKSIQISKNSVISLFGKLDSIKKIRKDKKLMDFKYDDPFRAIFYFDGKDFYRLNNQFLSSSSLNSMDSFIRLKMFNGMK